MYKTIKEYVRIWNISERRIRKLCTEGRIEGAVKIGGAWNIPEDTTKPVDNRVKKKQFEVNINSNFSYLDSLIEKYNYFRPLSDSQLKTIREDLNLRWTYHSNAIEGNTLTLKETKVAIEGITIGGKSIVEHLEAINHTHALDYLYEIAVNEYITERSIKDIHRLILVNIDNNNAGKYRNENVLISGAIHKPPMFIEVPILMSEFIEMLDSLEEYHPIIKAAVIHGEFVKIHPFADGNGRTSRILMNFSLMNSRLIPIVVNKEDRLRYYEALDKAHTTSDYNDFVELLMQLAIAEYELRLGLLK